MRLNVRDLSAERVILGPEVFESLATVRYLLLNGGKLFRLHLFRALAGGANARQIYLLRRQLSLKGSAALVEGLRDFFERGFLVILIANGNGLAVELDLEDVARLLHAEGNLLAILKSHVDFTIANARRTLDLVRNVDGGHGRTQAAKFLLNVTDDAIFFRHPVEVE